jgi:hypothetical protein
LIHVLDISLDLEDVVAGIGVGVEEFGGRCPWLSESRICMTLIMSWGS